MEISKKSNFRFKALTIMLIVILILMGSSFFSIVKATDEEEVEETEFLNDEEEEPEDEEEAEEPEDEDIDDPFAEEDIEMLNIGLNRKVEFVGETHFFSDGRAIKLSLFRRGQSVRKTYTEEKPGCGVITIVREGSKYPYYVFGEGWIEKSQIINSQRYITVKFDKGAKRFNLDINGEYSKVVMDKTGVVRLENGQLVVAGNGTTDITFIRKDGTEIKALAKVSQGQLSILLPTSFSEGITATVTGSVDANILEKGTVSVVVDAAATLKVDEEGLHAELKGTEDDAAILEVVVADNEGKEIAKVDLEAEGRVDANMEGASGSGNFGQSVTFFDKIKIMLKEKIAANVDREQASIAAGGSIATPEKEIASAEGELEYTYSEEDPTGSARVNVLETTILDREHETIPVISGLKALIQKIRK